MKQLNAKKSLGQNFLKDENVLQKISDSFEVNSDDVIIEIGPGMGALTKYLVKKPSSFVCIEKDERMKDFLDSYESDKVKVIYDDFLNCDLNEFKNVQGNIYVIANIPYYITTPIVKHILFSELNVFGMTLLVQREVAERFCATPGSRDYGYFTVLLHHFYDVHKLFDVSPSCFFPKPKVWSSVVKLVRKENIVDLDILKFQSFLKQCFSMKRKTLKNNLKGYDFDKIKNVLEFYGYGESVRAEEISYEVFVELFLKLK